MSEDSVTKVCSLRDERRVEVNDVTDCECLWGSSYYAYPILDHTDLHLVDLEQQQYKRLERITLRYDLNRQELAVYATVVSGTHDEATLVVPQRIENIKFWRKKFLCDPWFLTLKTTGGHLFLISSTNDAHSELFTQEEVKFYRQRFVLYVLKTEAMSIRVKL